MAKRKLTRNQSRRIKQKQNDSNAQVTQPAPHGDDAQLGPEQEGRVIAHYGTQVDIEYGEQQTRRCFLRANLASVVTGDHIIWRDGDDIGVVVSCQPRRSLLSRPDSYGKLKPVAANVDQIIVTVAPRPECHTNLIDRYLVVAEANDIHAIILINKADLIDEQNEDFFAELRARYTQLGYPVLTISAKQGLGADELNTRLRDNTSILVGQSGVGKSSIIKHLVPEQEIQIGDLSDAKHKGRHTTTHSQLFHFRDGGECIDSPGIREFGLWHLTPETVTAGFVELRELAGQCKFRDCTHAHEPGCALHLALEEERITQQRFESYQRIIASLNDVNVRPNATPDH